VSEIEKALDAAHRNIARCNGLLVYMLVKRKLSKAALTEARAGLAAGVKELDRLIAALGLDR